MDNNFIVMLLKIDSAIREYEEASHSQINLYALSPDEFQEARLLARKILYRSKTE